MAKNTSYAYNGPMTTVQIDISELTPSGLALGRLEGLPVFVPGGVPGDRLLIRLTSQKKHHAFGQVLKVIKAGADRITPRCGSFPACGGCQWQMLSYPAQLRYKTKMVRDALARIGRLDARPVRETLGADGPWFYRNKVQYPLGQVEGRLVMGYYQPQSHRIVDLAECYIQEKILTETARVCRRVLADFRLPIYDERTGYGLLRHLVLRSAVGTGEILLGLVTTRPKIPREAELISALRGSIDKLLADPGLNSPADRHCEPTNNRHCEPRRGEAIYYLAGIVQNLNPQRTNVIFGQRSRLLWGRDRLRERFAHLDLSVSLTAFQQVNSEMAQKLYRTVEKAAALRGRETVLDLYSGIGLISLWLARRAGRIFGIEENAEAVRDAVQNARANRLDNCHFLAGPVEREIDRLTRQKVRPDIVILDPPRVGASDKALAKIISLKAPKIIYVSCNPTTLARDLSRLARRGYYLESVQPLDMFPQTSHVETVAILCHPRESGDPSR